LLFARASFRKILFDLKQKLKRSTLFLKSNERDFFLQSLPGRGGIERENAFKTRRR
jgi:hypothetical protein